MIDLPNSQPENEGSGPPHPLSTAGLLYGEDGRVRPIWRALLFGLLLSLLGTLLGQFLRGLEQHLPYLPALAVGYAVFNGLLVLLTWAVLQLLDRRSFRAVGLWLYKGWQTELMRGVGIGGGLMVLVVGLLVVTRGVTYHGLANPDRQTWWSIAGVGALMLLAAVFEEMAFRGYAFQRLVDSVGALWATGIGSALFGLVHLGNPSSNPLSTVNTLLAGVLLSVAYLRTRALWLPIGLHWAWNFYQGPLFTLPVSGLHFSRPLWRVDIGGPRWLTGGSYGPEGSAAATLVCVLAIAWLARTRLVSTSPEMAEALK